MTDTDPVVREAQRARKWALIIPREHGAWGLLLVPLFTGVVAGFASAHRLWPLLAFTVSALSLFWLRTPVESLLGFSTMAARNPHERKLAFTASLILGAVAAGGLAALLWKGQNRYLLLFGAAAAFTFVAQAVVRRFGRSARMPSQWLGAIGLTCTAPAAYYIGSGRLDQRAFVLWAANWIFAANQIHFVQLRIHAARAAGFSEKFPRARMFFLAQPLLLMVLTVASFLDVVPRLAILAFVPALIRGTAWFFRQSEPLDIKRLGWSEMRQGVTFGILLATAFVVSW